mgnify:CR=1 FL=1
MQQCDRLTCSSFSFHLALFNNQVEVVVDVIFDLFWNLDWQVVLVENGVELFSVEFWRSFLLIFLAFF